MSTLLERQEALEKSVRPIVTLALTAAVIWGFTFGKISGEVFAPMVTGVVMYWFGQRQAEKAQAKLTGDVVASTSTSTTETTTQSTGGT